MKELNKHRITQQRRVIYEELRKSKIHPTADRLYAMVRKRLPKISLATVYRNLDLLVRQGQVRRLDTGSKQRFDADLHEHYHIRCIKCDRIEDINKPPLEIAILSIKTANDYNIKGYKLEFLGICPGCQRKESRHKKLNRPGPAKNSTMN